MKLKDLFENDLDITNGFKLKDKLCPSIFNNTNELHEDVKDKLLEITDNFIDFLGVEIFVHDIVLTGSIANYNWSDYSDIDLHIIVDFDEIDYGTIFLKEFFDSKKELYNKRYDIKIKGFEVELYVQDIDEGHVSSGVYSIINDEWVVEPSKKSESINVNKIIQKSKKFTNQIDKLMDSDYTIDDINHIVKSLKRYRKSGLESGGEFSYENLVFKLLRRNGYIKKLYDLKTRVISKNLSLK